MITIVVESLIERTSFDFKFLLERRSKITSYAKRHYFLPNLQETWRIFRHSKTKSEYPNIKHNRTGQSKE